MIVADDAAARTTVPVTLTVNGRPVRADVEPRTHLADFIRDRLDLTGTHLGCEHGVCGACTVLLDGAPARACLSLAAGCAGADVTTIEGLDEDEITVELRAAFTREHALQCGYCTPGMLVAARDLVQRLPAADERRVRFGLAGNLCRCTGYAGIVRAVLSVIAARQARGASPASPSPRGGSLGPVGARPGAAASVAVPVPPATAPMAATAGVDLSGAFTPAHTFTQEFSVPFPPDRVFALFGDVEAVAACLPGAVVTAMPAPDRVEGGMRVALGPIATTFRGSALITRDGARREGSIRGAGGDGRSSTQGEIRYRIDDGAATGSSRVELTVGYALKGPLAQFGRPGLVRDLAARLVAGFAGNLEAHLAGRSPATSSPPRLDAMRLLAGLLVSRLTTWFRRVRSTGGPPTPET